MHMGYTHECIHTHTHPVFIYIVFKSVLTKFVFFSYYVKTWWFIHVVLKHWGKHCSTVHVSTVCCIFIIKFVFSDGSATASGCLP